MGRSADDPIQQPPETSSKHDPRRSLGEFLQPSSACKHCPPMHSSLGSPNPGWAQRHASFPGRLVAVV
jgi:hypothetical protein